MIGKALVLSIAIAALSAATSVAPKAIGKPGITPVYLTGVSMGGHVPLLGMQEFPASFAGGLALCPSGPGEMDFLTSVAAASELITGITVTEATRDDDVARLTAVLGKPPDYTDSPGHCNFSASEQADAFDSSVAWARNGKRPDGDNVLGDLTDAGTKFTNPLRPGDPGMIRVQSNR